jgi:hypothetical protein
MRVRSSHEGLDEMLSGNLQTHFMQAGKELPKAYKIQFPIQMLMYSDQSLGERDLMMGLSRLLRRTNRTLA